MQNAAVDLYAYMINLLIVRIYSQLHNKILQLNIEPDSCHEKSMSICFWYDPGLHLYLQHSNLL
jgi:hypothetical protein